MDKAMLKQFLTAGFVYNRHLNPTKAGTPQGGIISPILANMALDGLEMAIASRWHVTKRGISDKRRCNPHKVNFVRYADDVIVTAASEETAKEIAELINGFLKERGLDLSAGRIIIDQSYLRRYSAIWTTGCGICSGDGPRGGIRTSPEPGLPERTGIAKALGTGCSPWKGTG